MSLTGVPVHLRHLFRSEPESCDNCGESSAATQECGNCAEQMCTKCTDMDDDDGGAGECPHCGNEIYGPDFEEPEPPSPSPSPQRCRGVTQEGSRCRRTSAMPYEECDPLKNGELVCLQHDDECSDCSEDGVHHGAAKKRKRGVPLPWEASVGGPQSWGRKKKRRPSAIAE